MATKKELEARIEKLEASRRKLAERLADEMKLRQVRGLSNYGKDGNETEMWIKWSEKKE